MIKCDQPFNIEAQFQMYAKLCKLDLDNVDPVQVIETRRAFYGAWGQLLVVLRDDLSKVSEDEGVEILATMVNDVSAFWKRQAKI